MDRDSIRQFCLSLPHATEDIQWGADLLFRVGNKIFTSLCLEPTERPLTFKCTPEVFAELCERDGIAPAAYVGRYQFVSARLDAISPAELRELMRNSYDLVVAGLPAKLRLSLGTTPVSAARKPAPKRSSRGKRPARRAGKKTRR